MLTANELGEKGESRFKEICADAKLICNKSDRDLAGWDFIVDFPFEDDGEVSLDSRPSPISCHVQVKTLLEKTNRFKMRLSSAERLAKEQKPSFVYVLKVNDRLEFVESFLIHILDDTLAVILKRLRKEHASSSAEKKINKKEITLPVNKNSARLNVTGLDLRAALGSMCGESTDAYVARKSAQLKSLGFDVRPYELKATLHFGSDDEIVDAFLGIKDDIPASNLKAFQTRFGIKLPEHLPSGDAKVSIKPSAFDQCTISFQQALPEIPVAFKGEIFGVAIPGLPLDKNKALIKADFFSIEIKKNSLRVTTTIEPETKYRPQDWLRYWRAMHIISTGSGTLKIQSSKLPRPIEALIPQVAQLPDVSTCLFWIDVCEKTSVLISRAGNLDEPIISMHEIEANADKILAISEMLKGRNCLSILTTAKVAAVEGMKQVDALFADFIVIGLEAFAYYGVAQFSLEHKNEQTEWTPTKFEPKGFKAITVIPEQFDDLIEKAKVDFGISIVLAIRPIWVSGDGSPRSSD